MLTALSDRALQQRAKATKGPTMSSGTSRKRTASLSAVDLASATPIPQTPCPTDSITPPPPPLTHSNSVDVEEVQTQKHQGEDELLQAAERCRSFGKASASASSTIPTAPPLPPYTSSLYSGRTKHNIIFYDHEKYLHPTHPFADYSEWIVDEPLLAATFATLLKMVTRTALDLGTQSALFYFKRAIQAKALKDIPNAETTWKRLISTLGCPVELGVDRTEGFVSQKLALLLNMLQCPEYANASILIQGDFYPLLLKQVYSEVFERYTIRPVQNRFFLMYTDPSASMLITFHSINDDLPAAVFRCSSLFFHFLDTKHPNLKGILNKIVGLNGKSDQVAYPFSTIPVKARGKILTKNVCQLPLTTQSGDQLDVKRTHELLDAQEPRHANDDILKVITIPDKPCESQKRRKIDSNTTTAIFDTKSIEMEVAAENAVIIKEPFIASIEPVTMTMKGDISNLSPSIQVTLSAAEEISTPCPSVADRISQGTGDKDTPMDDDQFVLNSIFSSCSAPSFPLPETNSSETNVDFINEKTFTVETYTAGVEPIVVSVPVIDRVIDQPETQCETSSSFPVTMIDPDLKKPSPTTYIAPIKVFDEKSAATLSSLSIFPKNASDATSPSSPISSTYMSNGLKLPAVFGAPPLASDWKGQLHLTHYTIGGIASSLGFLSRHQLPECSLPIYIESVAESVKFSCIPLPDDVRLGVQMKEFNSLLVNLIIRTKLSLIQVSKQPLIIVPVKADENGNFTVDMDALANLSQSELCILDQMKVNTPSVPNAHDWEGKIVCDAAQYGRLYLVSQVHENLTPKSTVSPIQGQYDTLLDYYSKHLKMDSELIDENQPLFEVGLHPVFVQYKKNKRLPPRPNVFSLPQYLRLYPISSGHVLQDALRVPIVMAQLHHYLLMLEIEAKEDSDNSINSDEFKIEANAPSLRAAFTAPVSGYPVNGDIYALFGDAFLKLQVSVHLFVNFLSESSGPLSKRRTLLISNDNLTAAGKCCDLDLYLSSIPLSRKAWRPPVFEDPALPDRSTSMQKLPDGADRRLADAVQAVIGASVISRGIEAASRTTRKIASYGGLPATFKSFSEYHQIWLSYCSTGYKHTLASDDLRKVKYAQNRLGYTFTDPHLLLEATRHGSAVKQPTSLQSYERLEFLGDAVLGYLVTEFVNEVYPEANQSVISDLRVELVNNQFLGVVAASIDLISCMDLCHRTLGRNLEKFREWYSAAISISPNPSTHEGGSCEEREDLEDDMMDESEAVPVSTDLLFWKTGAAAPKAAGDILEAVVAAIFVDSNFNIDIARRVVRQILIKPWFWRWEAMRAAGSTLAKINPVRELLEWIGKHLHCVLWTKRFTENTIDLSFSFLLHGNSIGFGKGNSKKMAKENAARAALRYIQLNSEQVKAWCTCRQKEVKRDEEVPVSPSHIRFEGAEEGCDEAADVSVLFGDMFDDALASGGLDGLVDLVAEGDDEISGSLSEMPLVASNAASDAETATLEGEDVKMTTTVDDVEVFLKDHVEEVEGGVEEEDELGCVADGEPIVIGSVPQDLIIYSSFSSLTAYGEEEEEEDGVVEK